MGFAQAIAKIFAKTKEDELCTRWLCGDLYKLVKERSAGYGATYKWVADTGEIVGLTYRSRDMAEVHFGSWLKH